MRRWLAIALLAIAQLTLQASAGVEQALLPASVHTASGEELVCLGQTASPAVGENASSGDAGACSAATAQPAAHAAPLHSKSRMQTLAELAEENDWKNDVVLFWLPREIRDKLPRAVHSWLRNYVAVLALYFAVGGAWSYYIYWCFGTVLFAPGKMPGVPDVVEQIKVAMGSMPLYAALPAATEAVVEAGWTRVYSRIADVGAPRYLAYFALYMASVEFFVYWMHRGLHDVKLGYRLLHHTHHKYNKEHTLSPFAGLAFNALDGILQAIPYCWMLFIVPMHLLTHELLLFATGIWTANIHDNIDGRCMPVMGAGYHTIHHTTYKHNYGHYLVYMDWLFGSLVSPDEYAAELAAKKDRGGLGIRGEGTNLGEAVR